MNRAVQLQLRQRILIAILPTDSRWVQDIFPEVACFSLGRRDAGDGSCDVWSRFQRPLTFQASVHETSSDVFWI